MLLRQPCSLRLQERSVFLTQRWHLLCLHHPHCRHQTNEMYMVGRTNSASSAVLHAWNTSGHVTPIRMPRETRDHLNRLPCHHFKVNDLKMFIKTTSCGQCPDARPDTSPELNKHRPTDGYVNGTGDLPGMSVFLIHARTQRHASGPKASSLFRCHSRSCALCEREALCLLAAREAFLDVVFTFAVSHKHSNKHPSKISASFLHLPTERKIQKPRLSAPTFAFPPYAPDASLRPHSTLPLLNAILPISGELHFTPGILFYRLLT